jgi:hypothetical protein
MPLSADDLKKACRPNITTLAVPGIGDVCMRTMTLRHRDQYEKAAVDAGGKIPDDFRSVYLSYCLCDADGKLLFDSPEGREQLKEFDSAVCSRLFDAALKYNRMTEADIKELAGN